MPIPPPVDADLDLHFSPSCGAAEILRARACGYGRRHRVNRLARNQARDDGVAQIVGLAAVGDFAMRRVSTQQAGLP